MGSSPVAIQLMLVGNIDKIDANDESGADLGKHNIFNILVIGI